MTGILRQMALNARQGTSEIRPLLTRRYGAMDADHRAEDGSELEERTESDSPEHPVAAFAPPRIPELRSNGRPPVNSVDGVARASTRSELTAPRLAARLEEDTVWDAQVAPVAPYRNIAPLELLPVSAQARTTAPDGDHSPHPSPTARAPRSELAPRTAVEERRTAEAVPTRAAQKSLPHSQRRSSEPAPEVTVSIGHIEIRSAPAPAPARRAEFRPSVTLTDFLKKRSEPRS